MASNTNMRAVFDMATDAERRIAITTFHKMHALTYEIAARWGFTGTIGAAVFAALSPNNDFHGNLRDANKLLNAASRGYGIDDFSVSTYGQNKRKAWRIAKGESPYDLIIADKTRNFFLNVEDPNDPKPVTIDGHMYNIWLGSRKTLVGMAVPKNRYEQVADGVREIAHEVNLIPNQVQGILWWTWRRIHGIQTSQQKEMWDVEHLHAGLGFKTHENK